MKQHKQPNDKDGKLYYLQMCFLVLAAVGLVVAIIWVVVVTTSSNSNMLNNGLDKSSSGKLIQAGKNFITSIVEKINGSGNVPDFSKETRILNEGNNFDLKTIFNIVDRAMKKVDETGLKTKL